jgi:hypothetical protein
VKFHIVTASDSQLENFIEPCLKSIEQCGYKPIFYNLGGLDYGIPFNADTSSRSHQKFPKKPFVIREALDSLEKDSWLAWLDIDCIMQLPIDDAISNDYDVGITFRKNHVNTGVSFWCNNKSSKTFLDNWCIESISKNGDQNALNSLITLPTPVVLDSIFSLNNINFKIFDSRTYNNFFFNKKQDSARIIHYKSKHRLNFPFNNI